MTDRTRRSLLKRGSMAVVGAGAMAGCLESLPFTENTVSAEDSPLIVAHDIVLGQGAVVEDDEVFCSLQNRFARDQQIVWRIRVVDGHTGDYQDDEDLESVQIDFQTLDEDMSLDAGYGPHPPNEPTDEYWVAAWIVPEDFPAGDLEYEFVVEHDNGDRSIEQVMFELPETTPLVIEDRMAESPDDDG